MLAIALWLLVKQLRGYFGDVKGGTVAVLDQARDAAASAADSARTVKGSVTFVSDTMVTPVIGVTAAVVGATQFVDSLIRGARGERRSGGGE